MVLPPSAAANYTDILFHWDSVYLQDFDIRSFLHLCHHVLRVEDGPGILLHEIIVHVGVGGGHHHQVGLLQQSGGRAGSPFFILPCCLYWGI